METDMTFKFFKHVLIFSLLLALLFVFATGCDENEDNNTTIPNLIAIYNGDGADHTSVEAIKDFVTEFGYGSEFVDHEDIIHSLSRYELVIFPDGDPRDMVSLLGEVGRDRIKSLVTSGGGFLGIGKGAYIAGTSMTIDGQPVADAPVGLYEGSAFGPHTIPVGGTSIHIDDQRFDPSLIGNPTVHYNNGPNWDVQFPTTSSVAATFNGLGEPAIILITNGSTMGAGRIALSSINPEIAVPGGTAPKYLLRTLIEWCLHELN